ncbi:MAG: ribosome assembly factor SBDS [Candidatus Bathyarchaeota archaeon]|nr:ribosome assembly factor SBDS [Candidatus Bathyarchaeum tardum]WGM88998.1 MAG: ribosome assembly factor SBDS [Candidatus Bathyarchaeum tardum]WNZ28765.1 MAG: ribosome assembly factor SBDS [Candidatus Bathyarchaeota archaeon]
MSDRYTIARITQNGEHFEILAKPELALSFKLGKSNNSVSEVIASDIIFTDAGKGTKASEEKLKEVFGTVDSLKIAEIILKKGDLQLTTDQRKQMVEEKRRQIIAFISRECIDPKTNLPHPPIRIEHAMEQIHFSIDASKSVEEQAKDIIKLLRPIIPLKMEKISVEVHAPPEHASRVYGTVKGFGTLKRDQWLADGSWSALVEMSAGSYGPLLDKLGKLTKGNIEAKIVK